MALVNGFPPGDVLHVGGCPGVDVPEPTDARTILKLKHERVQELLESASTVTSLDFNTALGDTIKEKMESLKILLLEVSNVICRKGAAGYFWIVIPMDVLQMLESQIVGIPYGENHLPLGMSTVDYVGILDRRWKVYCDQYMSAGRILIGVGGTNEAPEKYGRISLANFVL